MSNTRKAKNKQTRTPATVSPQGAAGQTEAQGIETVTVTWRDLTPFEVPRYRLDWPFEAVVAAMNENHPVVIASLLPPEIRAELTEMRCTMREAYDLMNAISDALGFESPGESAASTS